jgi:hypothetical protein
MIARQHLLSEPVAGVIGIASNPAKLFLDAQA